MVFPLTDVEARILGCLMEKQMTTPDLYPLSLNALKNACNQKSSRSPVVQYDESLIEKTLIALRNRELIYTVSSSGSRVRKYEERLSKKLFLNAREKAVICLLVLRGPQTIGELKNRSERMYQFASLQEVDQTIDDLAAESRRPLVLVKQIERAPGQKEPRSAHLICGDLPEETAPEMINKSIDPIKAEELNTIAETNMTENGLLEERVSLLEARLAELEEKLQQFTSQFE